MDNRKRLLAREWFDSALSDYEYAKMGLKEKIIFPQVAFLSQQVAEKLLKGFLVYNCVEPPRVHDLSKLLDGCLKISVGLDKLRDSCELLTGFYVETRYPPDVSNYTREDIEKAFSLATEIKETIEGLVKI